jgi:hypothetical protein
MMRGIRYLVVPVVLVASVARVPDLRACPFCSAMSETLAEQVARMDAAVVARLAEGPAPEFQPNAQPATKLRFRILDVIKGAEHTQGLQEIETIYFGDPRGKLEQSFLILGAEPPKLAWTAPLPLSERAAGYLAKLLSLPPEGPERLAFFLGYLEDEDDLLASDAYEEFARAPYDVVKALKSRLDHAQLVTWIQDPSVPLSRRRLYLTLLGVCGDRDDLPLLEELLRAPDRDTNTGLDAMIGCYLTLAGSEGLPLIEELFITNEDAEYADTYAAIMALRFHGSEGDMVPRSRVIEALRHILDRPQLADLVIPDLARWEDWSVMPRLVQLFKEAEEGASWVRVPVINYLQVCPKAEAQQYIKDLEKIDPEAVKRARTFFPFGASGGRRSGQRS